VSVKRAFDPVVDAQTRLLILGSLPGDASLKAGQYYGHPQNGFWRLVGGVIGIDLGTLPYPERLAALKADPDTPPRARPHRPAVIKPGVYTSADREGRRMGRARHFHPSPLTGVRSPAAAEYAARLHPFRR
jgi:hypothetical protein